MIRGTVKRRSALKTLSFVISWFIVYPLNSIAVLLADNGMPIIPAIMYHLYSIACANSIDKRAGMWRYLSTCKMSRENSSLLQDLCFMRVFSIQALGTSIGIQPDDHIRVTLYKTDILFKTLNGLITDSMLNLFGFAEYEPLRNTQYL